MVLFLFGYEYVAPSVPSDIQQLPVQEKTWPAGNVAIIQSLYHV